jgi:hypothetical protein
VWIHNLLFIPSLVDRHYVSIFAVMNNIAIFGQVFVWPMFAFHLGIFLGPGLLGYLGTLCLTFRETVKLSPKAAITVL